jgi:PAS domain S-box-containing protein
MQVRVHDFGRQLPADRVARRCRWIATCVASALALPGAEAAAPVAAEPPLLSPALVASLALLLAAVALLALAWGLRLRREANRTAAEVEADQRRLRTLIDTLPDPVWLKDPGGRFLGCNPHFERLAGLPEPTLLGRSQETLAAAAPLAELAAADREALAGKTAIEREIALPATADRPAVLLESQHAPVYDARGALLGVLGIARDVTQRHANERHLRRLNRLHEVLTAAHAALASERQQAPLMLAICRILVEQGGLRMAWIAQPDHAAGLMVPVAWAGVTGDYLDTPHGTIDPGPLGDTPCASAYRTGRPAWSTDLANDPGMKPWAEKATALGYRSSSAFPLKANGRVVAVFTVYSDTVEFFDDDELALLQRLSEDIGQALEGRERDLERAHAAHALRESESRFASMFKTSPTGMALCRFGDKAFLDVNAAFVDLLGYAPHELARRKEGDVPIWVDPPVREATWAALAATGEVRDVEARMRARDGRIVETSFSASRIRIGSDDLMLATVHDVRAERLARRTLEERQQELESIVSQRTEELSGILDAMPDLFFRMRPDGTIVDYRAGRRNDLLLTPEEFLGRRVPDVMPPSAAQPIMAAIARSRAAARTEIVEYPLALQDGEHFFEARVLPLGDDQVIAFVRNITDRKSLDADRERARQRAEELAMAKSEFLANMSHEIRTPLNGLLGLAQLGLREARDAATRHTFGAILDSGRLLLGIVDDVLDFSKLEVGKLRVEHQPVSPRDLAEDVVVMMRERAADKDIALALEVAPEVPARIAGDPLRIQQVLLNLLSNAVKFTERGGVSVELLLEPGAGAGPAARDLVFRVTDTGVGIAQEHLQLLFVAFQQADTSTTRRFGGTGLGLAISRRLAELMGGEIRVRSTLAVGSTFELRLPVVSPEMLAVAAPAAPEMALGAGTALRGLRILVAEDNEVNQLVLERALRLEGAEVVLVDDGRQAVARVVDAGAEAFDLVLMDIQMPEMDGHEATRRILEIAPRLPVIGQTAHAMQDEREECLASGMVDHIAKPIDFRRLVEVILRHVGERAGAALPR